ncbi:hypothetical protein GLV94_02990 [Virgibacillus halodenitrificans]|uniref:hypothetical protein n=1 Tax=Virgibacillus halodenitrificans TaxID=1482 RepID=UPI00136F2A20|nr:hypothetical protein [Virgibacillus halodenitrificans]MYL44599.1 hypothetical protein [Virgibacillus halodenitrificans]
MSKYIRNPVVVEAVPYEKGLEDGYTETLESLGNGIRGVQKVMKPYIQTDEGMKILEPGDYIITEENNNRYPMKPSIFESSYTRAD